MGKAPDYRLGLSVASEGLARRSGVEKVALALANEHFPAPLPQRQTERSRSIAATAAGLDDVGQLRDTPEQARQRIQPGNLHGNRH